MLNKNTIKKTNKLSKTIKQKTHKLSKTINILTISKLKKIYKDIISNDKLEYKQILLEFIFNYYLLLKGYRNIFQIMCTSKTLQELKEEHDAILIATGVYKAREIDIPGHNLQNIFPAMEFLTASNRKGLGDKVKLFDDGILNAEGKNVVVIGGGDTAMDCVRTSIRQKAKSVKCLYRRDRENMPGSAREVGNAIEEGVEFIWLTSPKSFIGETKVNEVEVNKMNLTEPDSSGRRRPEIEVGSEYRISADLVIKSLGFDPENIPKLFNAEELAISQWGTIKIDLKSMQTNLDGVFAAGDIVRGASLVVWAIRDGRDVAIQIEKYLQLKINKNKSIKAA